MSIEGGDVRDQSGAGSKNAEGQARRDAVKQVKEGRWPANRVVLG